MRSIGFQIAPKTHITATGGFDDILAGVEQVRPAHICEDLFRTASSNASKSPTRSRLCFGQLDIVACSAQAPRARHVFAGRPPVLVVSVRASPFSSKNARAAP